MKAMNICRKYGAKFAAAGGLMGLATTAMAAVPESIKTELATAKTDSLEVGALVIGVIAAIFALMMIRRVLR
ncbi:major capsid protein [Paralysiella testudinis]|uniref:Uncharacterized protein n=1 Tax=Paralysiella testudinis TaxID=2809020 RepID=A0A892ZKQ4_9NEIS|nr:major capsid protein [Paralysiella testudinis]QRQ83040.1 hypothetical protein JQU52_06680 [Paralysiella testudinis]